jgi:hypothetical protein
MKLLTRRRVLIEEEGSTYMANKDSDSDEARVRRPLQAAVCRVLVTAAMALTARTPARTRLDETMSENFEASLS